MKKKYCAIMFVVFAIVSVSGCARIMGITTEKEEANPNLPIVAYFEKETTQEQKNALQLKISELEGVLDTKYISGEQAWEEFQEQYFGETSIEGLSQNPLSDSDSLEIYFNGTETSQEQLISEIEKMEGIRKVNKSVE